MYFNFGLLYRNMGCKKRIVLFPGTDPSKEARPPQQVRCAAAGADRGADELGSSKSDGLPAKAERRLTCKRLESITTRDDYYF